jgi:hypothetical protein
MSNRMVDGIHPFSKIRILLPHVVDAKFVIAMNH